MQKVSATLNLRKYSPFFFFHQQVYTASASNRECNVENQREEALEWRLKTRQKSKGCLQPQAQIQMQYGNQFCVQRKANTAENSHSLKLRCGYGAERTRQRSFKPRSEFNFLFRDTAGFQTDLPGSGTQN